MVSEAWRYGHLSPGSAIGRSLWLRLAAHGWFAVPGHSSEYTVVPETALPFADTLQLSLTRR